MYIYQLHIQLVQAAQGRESMGWTNYLEFVEMLVESAVGAVFYGVEEGSCGGVVAICEVGYGRQGFGHAGNDVISVCLG